jgi:uncharacterized membrane protein YbhN (UPF0104 family)
MPSWPAIRSLLKFLLAVAIVLAIGRRFALDLQGHSDLFSLPLRPGWLILSGLLYLLALGFSAFYWHRLLLKLGQKPTILGTVRAYYVSQTGKYLPGKAWALFFRAALAREAGVRTGVAVASSFYEVLTTMSAGVLVAAIVFMWTALGDSHATSQMDWDSLTSALRGGPVEQILLQPWIPSFLAIALLVLIGAPILPPVFNRIVGRIGKPFRRDDSLPLPQFDFLALAEGLIITTCGWFLLSASLWAILQGMLTDPPVWSLAHWVHSTAYLGLAYVAGFIILVVPSGIGVRELLLIPFLASDLERLPNTPESKARALAILAVVGLRIVWTTAEVSTIAILYWVPVAPPNPLLRSPESAEGEARFASLAPSGETKQG